MTFALRASTLITTVSRTLPVALVAGSLAFAAVAPAHATDAATKTEAAKPAKAADAKAKATDAKAPAKEESKAPPAPAPKALPPELSGECAWTGKRIVSLLARDDVDQAKRFLEFYRLFNCKESHIAPTFRCVIAADAQPAQPAQPAQAGQPAQPAQPEVAFGDRVDQCWEREE